MNQGGKALIGLVGAHSDALKLFQLAEEILDEVTPGVKIAINLARLPTVGMQGDDDG